LQSGGIRAVTAESLLRKPQILISNHSRRRAPNLSPLDSLALGLTTLFMRPHRTSRRSVILKPTALQKFHNALVDRKYRLIISSSANRRKPGQKGRSTEPTAAYWPSPAIGGIDVADRPDFLHHPISSR